LDAQLIQAVTDEKSRFENDFTKSLVAASLKNIVEKAVPLEGNEKAICASDNFKAGLSLIADKVAEGYLSGGQAVSSGNFFDSMVGCIKEHVSLEADDRMTTVMNTIALENLDMSNIEWRNRIYKCFGTNKFQNPVIKSRFIDRLHSVISVEEAGIIDDIKTEVTDAMEETETKSKLIEETVTEIAEVKKELDPESDDYANKPAEDTSTQNAEGEAGAVDPSGGEDVGNTADEGGESEISNDPEEATNPEEDENGEATVIDGEIKNSAEEKDATVAAEEDASTVALESIPALPRFLTTWKKPNIASTAASYFRATGDIKEAVNLRLDSLRIAFGVESASPEKTKYLETFKELEMASEEALAQAGEIEKHFLKLGLTQNGIYKKGEVSFECAKNIIGRFVNHTIPCSLESFQWNDTKEILDNAWNIVHFKREIREGKHRFNSGAIDKFNSMESAFYKNLVDVEKQDVKDAALHVVNLQDVILEKCINTEFVKDFKMNVLDLNVRDIKNVNEEVYNRVTSRMKETWGRELTQEEKDIIKATTNTEDSTEILPTPFEKFMIKFGRDAYAKSAESGPIMHIDEPTRKKVKLRSKVYTTLWLTMEHCGLVNADDAQEFEKFFMAWK
jgi:23S rRNA maturation mini-RNase III